MASSTPRHTFPLQWRRALVALLASSTQVLAQDCYYPNGDISPNDSPCSSDGGACCPLNWECLSNGLCYLEQEKYYERHTCTDQSWDDPYCPNMCTYNGTAAGNEAILLCDEEDDSSWCCNANRVSFNCCTKSDATTFSLGFGAEFTKIESEPSSRTSTPARTTSSTTSSDEPSTTDEDSSTSRSSTPTSTHYSTSTSSSTRTRTATVTAVTSDSDGQVTTITSISVITTAPQSTDSPAAAPVPEEEEEESAQPAHERRMPIILGVSIGVPLGLIALALVLYILRRQRKHKANMIANPHNDVFFPPDPPAFPKRFEKAELDSHPTSFAEKQQHHIPTELEASSPNTASNSISPMAGSNDARWSAVSSLAPPTEQYPPAAGVAPMAAGLHAVSQQHYGPGQNAASQQYTYRPYRPPTGFQPAAELAGSEVSSPEKPGSAASADQSGNVQGGGRKHT